MQLISSLATVASLASIGAGHAIFQRVSVNGADQGLGIGVRYTNTPNPLYSISDPQLACNVNIRSTSEVITIPAGARVGTNYRHAFGGAQYAGDADDPIAASHKGPVTWYMAKVDNAATTGTTGLNWFKVAEDGLNNGKWGVDNMLASGGWSYFNMPSCIAPGDYLLRTEIIALHSAYAANQAQLYPGCANVRITGSGSFTGAGKTVQFPGAYANDQASLLINIYGNTGKPDNGGKAYKVPGPAPITC